MLRKRLAVTSAPVVLTAVALAISPLTALADPPVSTQAETPETITKLNEAFSILHAVNQSATKFSKLAEKRAKSDLVKEYANTMATANEAADKRLMQVASQEGISVAPIDPKTEYGKSLVDRFKAEEVMLSSLQGDAFDKAFMTLVTNTQQSTLNLLQKHKALAKDDDVKNFLGELITIVQARLQTSQDIMAKIYGDKV